jgi:hypothetical protein
MKSDCKLLYYKLHNYRRAFLKRKNINGWKPNIDGTPVIVDKLLNSFNRKIKGIPMFTDEVKREYFEGLSKIFANYYDELKFNNLSRKDAYYTYLASNFKTTGRGHSLKNNLNELMTFKEFIAAGICNNYR